jgi:uncharacterized protein DUF4031
VTIYVDNFRVPAQVGRRAGSWSHLFSDTSVEELHEFAQRIGLKRSWFQPRNRRYDRGPDRVWRNHYDVTESKRVEAIAAGAIPITIREFSEIAQRLTAAEVSDHERIAVAEITG